jgi:hypothetical protein
MKNKHPQMYGLNENARRQILEQFVARYIDHVSPENVNTSDHRSHDVASEILAIGPIQMEDITIDNTEVVTLHEIKVEDTTRGTSTDHMDHPGTSKETSRDPGSRPPDNLMQVELGEEPSDSEMLLVK